ncbi:protein takeout-like [Vanessa cardui]|uniref:protein takeout-like n=1 Tax=Vanessa cardui TaxID=171605 RepID=UPI001F13009A|nr:protein takeout-like [Vanessa cardui]
MFITLFFTIFCLSTGILSSSIPSGPTLPCDITDESCVTKLANILLPHLLTGVQGIELPSIDPLYVDEVVGDLSILKYKFNNSTVLGFHNCKASNIKLDKEFTKLNYDFICPQLSMTGIYEIKGRLILLPVEGNGDFKMTTGKYLIHVESELKKSKGKTDKIHGHIKNFKLKCEALEPIYFDFKNLFNGQKDLSDAVHKFAHENWQEVANLVQDPVFYASMKIIVTATNKYLKHVPLEEILSL